MHLKVVKHFFQRIHHQILNFQRNQHKFYIISAHSADFLQKYPLTAADPYTRDKFQVQTRVTLSESRKGRTRVTFFLTEITYDKSRDQNRGNVILAEYCLVWVVLQNLFNLLVKHWWLFCKIY